MKNASIKIKVAVITSVIVVISMILLSFVSAFLNKKDAMNTNYATQADQLRLIDLLIQDLNAVAEASLKASLKRAGEIPLEELKNSRIVLEKYPQSLFQISKNAARLAASYLGYPNGEVVESTSETEKNNVAGNLKGGKGMGYMSTERPWYIGALKNNGLYQTGVYQDSITGKPSFSYAMPYYRDNELIGVFGVDVLLVELQKHFDYMYEKSSSSHSFFVLDSKGIPFLATNKNIILQKDPFYNKIAQISENTGDFEPFQINEKGIEYIGQCKSYKDVRFANYTLCSLTPLKDVEDPIVKAAYIQLGISILFAFIVSILLYIAVRHFLSPINPLLSILLSFFKYLNHETKEAPKPIIIKTQDELGIMAKAINDNIQKTQKGLEQDAKAIEQSAQTAKEIESGNLTEPRLLKK